MTEPLGVNGQPVQHPHAAALCAGAKVLRQEARKYAFESGLYDGGIHSATFKRASTVHKRLLRQAAELEQLAGHTNAVNQARKYAPK